MRRIAALVPSVLGTSPGQRTRIEFWAARLPEYGWTVDFFPFEDARLGQLLHQRGAVVSKASSLASCYARQLRQVLRLPSCDAVFVYREAAQIGPALLERLAKRVDAPLVYDLDDPTFVPYRSPTNSWASLLKFPGKASTLLRMADHVITVNDLIGEYSCRFNSSVTVVPMFVDVEQYRPAPEPAAGAPTLVWSGSRSTMSNLHSIAPVLRRLQAERRVAVRVVGEGSLELPGVSFELREFAVEREASDLQDCHIGLVPLPDVPWNHWKFFFKAVQYMAAGLPVVAQRIGSNAAVVEDGVNGFLVDTPDDWYDRLRTLVDEPELRGRMALAARQRAVEEFSVEAQMPRVAGVFDRAADAWAARGRASSQIGTPPLDGSDQS